eukprot:jgi/Chlat1/5604/Chrsp369S05371
MAWYMQWHFCSEKKESDSGSGLGSGSGLLGWGAVSPALLVLVGVVLGAFFLLGDTAESYFCVTLLAFGNGSPDVFSSVASIVGGDSHIAMAAIVSAGSFVTAFVVGAVALTAPSFTLPKAPFLRDLGFYLVGAAGVFAATYDRKVYVWEATLCLLFYALYVFFVAAFERRTNNNNNCNRNARANQHQHDIWVIVPQSPMKKLHLSSPPPSFTAKGGVHITPNGLQQPLLAHTTSVGEDVTDASERARTSLWHGVSTWWREFVHLSVAEKVRHIVYLLPDVVRRGSIPATDEAQWNRTYAALNMGVCPAVALWMLAPAHVWEEWQWEVWGGTTQVPAWGAVAAVVMSLVVVWHYRTHAQPPRHVGRVALALAFCSSVVWISIIARVLLEALASVGAILGVTPGILGITVLAWGNSTGDLVADVALARAGQPAMAIAGCYAGPMFNMLVGLGLALTIQTARTYPLPFLLPASPRPHTPLAFAFLFASLIGSAVAVPAAGFRLTKTWGGCLIALYITFTAVSLLRETGLL